MTPQRIEILVDNYGWMHTAPMFLKHGDIVRLMKKRPWFSREFLGDKFLAMLRWEFDKVLNRFVFETMTDDGLNEMWPE